MVRLSRNRLELWNDPILDAPFARRGALPGGNGRRRGASRRTREGESVLSQLSRGRLGEFKTGGRRRDCICAWQVGRNQFEGKSLFEWLLGFHGLALAPANARSIRRVLPHKVKVSSSHRRWRLPEGLRVGVARAIYAAGNRPWRGG